MAVGQFKSYTWDPFLIISQIIAVQAIFYISLGMLLYGLNFAVDRHISLSQIFDVTVSVASCLNFVGNIFSYPLIRRRTFVFQKIWCALFSCTTRFDIGSFALLPTV